MKILNIRHTGIVVENANDAIVYYAKMGFTVDSWGHEEWNGRRIQIAKMIDQDGNILELIQGDWFPHVSYTVDDIPEDDFFYEKFKGTLHIVFDKDNDGNWMELVEEGI